MGDLLIDAIYPESNKLRPDDPKFPRLQTASTQLQIDSQYLELWCWMNYHELLAGDKVVRCHADSPLEGESFIELLCREADIRQEQSDITLRDLLNKAWATYDSPSDNQVLTSK